MKLLLGVGLVSIEGPIWRVGMKLKKVKIFQPLKEGPFLENIKYLRN